MSAQSLIQEYEDMGYTKARAIELARLEYDNKKHTKRKSILRNIKHNNERSDRSRKAGLHRL